MKEITASELATLRIEGVDHVLIDVREPDEYQEDNLGGILIPLGDILFRIGDIEDHKEARVIVHCRSGKRSLMAQHMLLEQGFTDVSNLTGGIMAYRQIDRS